MRPWQDQTMTVRRRVVGPTETCHRCGAESARIQTDGNDEGVWWCEECFPQDQPQSQENEHGVTDHNRGDNQ